MEKPPGGDARMIHAEVSGVKVTRDAATIVCMRRRKSGCSTEIRNGPEESKLAWMNVRAYKSDMCVLSFLV